MPHLVHAFGAFCKNNRDDNLTDEETAALRYCDENCLLYMCPAIFHTRKPYPEFNRYLMCPPDMLHTVNGGFLKDWIFHVYIILHEVAKKVGRRYAGILNKLDTMVKTFPVQQGGGLFTMKRFDRGVTPYVVNKTGEVQSTLSYTYVIYIVTYTFYIYTYTFSCHRHLYE